MYYEEKISNFEEFVQTDNLKEVYLPRYLDVIIFFKGTREDILAIYTKYKDIILNMILHSDTLKDLIMMDDQGYIRHDKQLEEVVNLQEITVDNIFQRNRNHNSFEENARIIILLEIAKLINFYGMKKLLEDPDRISKEIRLGIFAAKTDSYFPKDKLEQIDRRINLSESFGEEAIPYIENFELLKHRIQALKNFSEIPEEIHQIDELFQKIRTVEIMMQQHDSSMLDLLKQCYSDYESLNREMLLARLNGSDENLLLLHFIPDFSNDFDRTQSEFFDIFLSTNIIKYIEFKYGREYDPENDYKEAKELQANYLASRKNPFRFDLRIPISNRYVNSSLCYVITSLHTNLSCSIGKKGSLFPHLNRKIAIGFSQIPITAIKTINTGYNNSLDRFSFEENSVPLPEVLEYIEKGGTNETLIDWTQIKPSYILIIKDTEEISEELLKIAEEYSNINGGLPIRIYEADRIQETISKECEPIEGSYNASNLAPFTKIRTTTGIVKRILNIFKKLYSRGDGYKDDRY